MAGVHSSQAGGSAVFVFTKTFSANTVTSYDAKADIVAAGWNGIDPVVATWTIATGIYLASSSTASPAFVLNAMPPNCVLTLVNNGYIVGKGGTGGVNYGGFNSPGGPGSAGGPALQTAAALSIDNTNGTIGGGGGGGGAAGSPTPDASYWVESGGGGGGAGFGVGGASGAYSHGVAGTLTAGGGGGVGYAGNTGATGGALGTVGNTQYPPNSGWVSGGAGGAAGNCTVAGSNAYITWIANGIRLGTLG